MKGIGKILISFIFIWLEVKKWRDEKICLYKFAHIPLLKNDVLLKKKRWQKSNHPNLLGNKNRM